MDRHGRLNGARRPRQHTRNVSAAGLRWPVASWLFVLVAIGVVQIVRVQWFDAAAFFVAAAVVAADATGVLRAPAGATAATGWTATVATITAVVLCFLPRHSPPMQVMVVAIGAATAALGRSGMLIAHPGRRTGFTPGIRRLALAWAGIFIAGCVWELVQFILGLVEPDAAWFSLSDLLNPMVGTVPGRIVFIAAWIAGGVWLVRRGGRR